MFNENYKAKVSKPPQQTKMKDVHRLSDGNALPRLQAFFKLLSNFYLTTQVMIVA